MEALEYFIKNKIPVVVSINAKMIGGPKDVNHTVVLVGINDGDYIVHDPEIGADRTIKNKEFLDAWNVRKNRIGYIKQIK